MNIFTIVVLLFFLFLVGVTFYLNIRKKKSRYGNSFDFSKMPNKSITGKRDKN